MRCMAGSAFKFSDQFLVLFETQEFIEFFVEFWVVRLYLHDPQIRVPIQYVWIIQNIFVNFDYLPINWRIQVMNHV